MGDHVRIGEPDSPLSNGIILELVACPLCGESAYSVLAVAPDRLCGLPGEFRVVQCAACRHRYTNPRPTAASLEHCYPASYTPHQPTSLSAPADGPSGSRAAQPAWLRVARWIPGLRSLYRWLSDTGSNWAPPLPRHHARALDVGCATGTFLRRLQQEGWDVAGVEPSQSAVRTARSAGLQVHQGTLSDANLPDAQFDAVFAWMVLEHVSDPRAALLEMRRIVRPDGWLIFSVPDAGSWEQRLFGKYWIDYDLPRHLQHFTRPVLERLLSETGFRIASVRHQSHGNSLLGSLGARLQDVPALRGLGRRFVAWFWNNPPFWLALLFAWPAKLLAACRMTGRMTVIARPFPPAAELTPTSRREW